MSDDLIHNPVIEPVLSPEPEGRPVLRMILPFIFAFCLPLVAMFVYTIKSEDFYESAKFSCRSGLIGLAAAVLVYGLAKIDSALGADKVDGHAASIARCLAVMLWLFFVVDGQAMLVAADEVSVPPAVTNKER